MKNIVEIGRSKFMACLGYFYLQRRRGQSVLRMNIGLPRVLPANAFDNWNAALKI